MTDYRKVEFLVDPETFAPTYLVTIPLTMEIIMDAHYGSYGQNIEGLERMIGAVVIDMIKKYKREHQT
jgi:hypothetical protein